MSKFAQYFPWRKGEVAPFGSSHAYFKNIDEFQAYRDAQREAWINYYQDGGVKIFEHYLSLNKRNHRINLYESNRWFIYHSPISMEKNASFAIRYNGRYFSYQDFSGHGNGGGSAIDLLKKMENINSRWGDLNTSEYKQFTDLLISIYGIPLCYSSLHKPINQVARICSTNASSVPKKNKPEIEIHLVNYKTKPFAAEEKEFWAKKIGMESDQLKPEFLSCKSLDSLHLRKVIKFANGGQKEQDIYINNIQHNYIYSLAPEHKNVKGFKIYAPIESCRPSYKESFYSKKEEKQVEKTYRLFRQKTSFLPTTRLSGIYEIEENFHFTVGANKLVPGSAAILCAGESDFEALKARGLNVFTDGAENSKISFHVLRKLKEKNVPELGILHDTDFSGLKTAYLLKEWMENYVQKEQPTLYIPVKIIHLPKLDRQEYKVFEKANAPGSFSIERFNGKESLGTIENHHITDDKTVLNQILEGLNIPISYPYLFEKPPANDACSYFEAFGEDLDFIQTFESFYRPKNLKTKKAKLARLKKQTFPKKKNTSKKVENQASCESLSTLQKRHLEEKFEKEIKDKTLEELTSLKDKVSQLIKEVVSQPFTDTEGKISQAKTFEALLSKKIASFQDHSVTVNHQKPGPFSLDNNLSQSIHR